MIFASGRQFLIRATDEQIRHALNAVDSGGDSGRDDPAPYADFSNQGEWLDALDAEVRRRSLAA